jgi:hypothetical protein
MTDDTDLTPEYIDSVCRAAPFADNDAGIPQMVALIRALSARLAALEAAKWNVQHTDTMNTIVQMGMARDQAESRAEAAEAQLAQAVEALRKIEQATTGEADPDTGELIEVWMDADEMQEIARATLAKFNAAIKAKAAEGQG